jgi:hypothetical protein
VFERWDRVGEFDDPTGYLFRVSMNVSSDSDSITARSHEGGGWPGRAVARRNQRRDHESTQASAVAVEHRRQR